MSETVISGEIQTANDDKGISTNDGFASAVRMIRDRQHVQSLAGASIKMNFLLTAALMFSLILNGVLGWYATHPVREYFASDNGRIIALIPMSHPYRKTADIIQYARDEVTRSFTLDFLNYRSQLEGVRGSYTRDGFKSFLDNLQGSGMLEAVRKRRMNMSVSAGTGVLTKEGTENGVYVWIVELPIEIKLAGQTTELPSQRFIAIVRIERVSTLDSIEGVGIGQLITRPM